MSLCIMTLLRVLMRSYLKFDDWFAVGLIVTFFVSLILGYWERQGDKRKYNKLVDEIF